MTLPVITRAEYDAAKAAIAQKFQLDIVPDFPIVPQASITLRPEYGLKMVLKKR